MKKTVAAIEFGTSKIVSVIADNTSLSRFDIIGFGQVPYDGYMDGRWNNSDEDLYDAVHDAIIAAETDAQEQIKEIYVGVPCEYIHVLVKEAEVDITGEGGRVSEDDLDLLMDAAADILNLSELDGCLVLHRSIAYLSIDGGKETMDYQKQSGSRLKGLVSFIVADINFVKAMCDLFGDMGITVAGFLSPLMGQLLNLFKEDERDRTVILIDSGYLNTEFSVIRGDAIIYHAVLPGGTGQMTGDLAYDLNISLNAAEQLKRSFRFVPDELDESGDPQVYDETGARLTFPKAVVERCLNTSMNELCSMIEDTINEDAQRYIKPRSVVYLTGGGISLLRGGKEYLSQRLGRPVKVPVTKGTKLNSPAYSAAAGLVQLIYDSTEISTPQSESLPGKVLGSVKNMFNKK